MKKISLGIFLLLCATGFAIYTYMESTRLCGAIYTWGQNEETGQCRYFISDCLESGYEPISVQGCNCNNIEDYLQPEAGEVCRAAKN